jgi:hypothetical protein
VDFRPGLFFSHHRRYAGFPMSLRLLLHRLSLAEAEAELVPVRAEALRAASFIDGRSDFSCGPPQTLALASFLRDEAAPAPPSRMIFHTGFCGSTLLARLLDWPAVALVLREPNCLADLANQRAAADRNAQRLEAFDAALASALRHLARPWADGETIVVKPSNWVNNLLPSLVPAGPLHPLFLVPSRRDFLTAVLRGGPDRVAFTARAAVHLSSASDEAARLLAAALGADQDQRTSLARIAVTTHEIQRRQFAAAIDRGGWGDDHRLDQAELTADPEAALRKAAAALDLDLPPRAIRANVAAWAGRHAKAPANAYSRASEQEVGAAIEAEHGATIERALEWAQATFDGA